MERPQARRHHAPRLAHDPHRHRRESPEIRTAEFTTSDVGDAPVLPELLDPIPPEQETGSVTADGAFDTRNCHDTIAARGAAAIIPPREGRPAREARHPRRGRPP